MFLAGSTIRANMQLGIARVLLADVAPQAPPHWRWAVMFCFIFIINTLYEFCYVEEMKNAHGHGLLPDRS